MTRREPALSPHVRFDPSFPARAERALQRLARRRALGQGEARWIHARAGEDFAGLRAYRHGDDARAIDWSATARAGEPIVRVERRAAGGVALIALDASRSMAVGEPGKLQRAAEVVATSALGAVRSGELARVRVLPHDVDLDLARADRFRALLAMLERVEAQGALENRHLRLPRAARATWIGDLHGLDAELLARAAPAGIPFAALQVVAPCELGLGVDGAVAWWDPESRAWLEVELEPGTRTAHARALERRHAALARVLARRGAVLARLSSAEPFEAGLARLAGP